MSFSLLPRDTKAIAATLLASTIFMPMAVKAQSLWDKIKQDAEQAKQQGQQAGAQIPKKPAAAKPAATPAAGAPPAAAIAPAGASDDFGTSGGTATIAAALGNVDIVGIKLGMPMQDAMAALAADNKSLKQTVGAKSCVSVTAQCSKNGTPHQTVGLSAVAANESVFVSFTPTTPQVVFSVKRQLKTPGTSASVLVASLEKKYGPESLNSDSPGNPLGSNTGVKSYVWLFDLQGHLAPAEQAAAFIDCADLANVGSNGVGSFGGDNAAINFDAQSHDTIAASSKSDPYPYPGTNHCVAVTSVTASMQVDASGMASSLAVEVGSFPLLHSSLRETWADFDQQFMSQPGKQQPATATAAAGAQRAPIPAPTVAMQSSAQPAAASGGRPPIPTPGAQAQAPAAPAAQVGVRAPIPMPKSTGTAAAGNAAVVMSIDASRMPDVVGIHLGSSASDAKAVLQQHYANVPIGTTGATGMTVKGGAEGDTVAVDLTEAPDTPSVWHIGRVATHQHIDRITLVTALRQKYGKESFNGHSALAAQPVADDQIQMMEWVLDEHGNPMPGATVVSGAVDGCTLAGKASSGSSPSAASFYESAPTSGAQALKGVCASLVVVGVQFLETTPIVETFYTSAADLALVNRDAKATYAWKLTQTQQKKQGDEEKAKEAKPTL